MEDAEEIDLAGDRRSIGRRLFLIALLRSVTQKDNRLDRSLISCFLSDKPTSTKARIRYKPALPETTSHRIWLNGGLHEHGG